MLTFPRFFAAAASSRHSVALSPLAIHAAFCLAICSFFLSFAAFRASAVAPPRLRVRPPSPPPSFLAPPAPAPPPAFLFPAPADNDDDDEPPAPHFFPPTLMIASVPSSLSTAMSSTSYPFASTRPSPSSSESSSLIYSSEARSGTLPPAPLAPPLADESFYRLEARAPPLPLDALALLLLVMRLTPPAPLLLEEEDPLALFILIFYF